MARDADGCQDCADRTLMSARRFSPSSLVLVAPAVLVFAGLYVWPQVSLLAGSFMEPQPFSLGNYRRFLFDSFHLMTLGRTLFFGACVTAITLACGFPLAFWLARLESRWAAFLVMVTTFPLWVSAVVRSFGWMVLFHRNGLISRTLQATGLSAEPVQLMYTLTGVTIAMAQVLLPLMVLALYGVLRGIDRDLENAAMNLGASPALAVWLVTLRLARGGIAAGSLLVFAISISAFATPSLVGGARAQLMAIAIYEQTLELLDWPFASTIAAILLLIALGVVFLYTRFIEGREVVVR
jgi:ABC-type spermidine/putrescine transport system permease subunit I